MGKILSIIICICALVGADAICLAQESRKISPMNSETEKISMDAETAKIAAQWMKQNIPPSEVIQAAETGYPRVRSVVRKEHLKEWKMSEESFNSARTFGNPIRIYKITLEKLRKFHKGDNVYSLVLPTNQWYFPVMSGGKATLLVMVDKMKEGPRAVGLEPMSSRWAEILEQWSVSKGYHPVFIDDDAHAWPFVTIPEKDQYNFTFISELPYAKKWSTYPQLDNIGNVLKWFKPAREKQASQWRDIKN